MSSRSAQCDVDRPPQAAKFRETLLIHICFWWLQVRCNKIRSNHNREYGIETALIKNSRWVSLALSWSLSALEPKFQATTDNIKTSLVAITIQDIPNLHIEKTILGLSSVRLLTNLDMRIIVIAHGHWHILYTCKCQNAVYFHAMNRCFARIRCLIKYAKSRKTS